jgi:hypothetical protein
MSFDNGLKNSFSLPAGADLTGKQFHAVVVNSSGNAAAAAANALAVGILQNKPTTGQPATICYDGVSKAAIGATVVAGAKLASDAAGKLITATTGQAVVGVALAGGATNDIIPVILTRVALG